MHSRRGSHSRQDHRVDRSGSGRSTGPSSRTSPGDGIANAKKNYERYMTLARAAALTGDSVEVENYFQHAEHHFRLMKARESLEDV